MLRLPAAAVLMRPGLGKTWCALTVIKILIRKGLIRRALVLAPLRPLYATWPRQIELWRTGLTCAIAHGPGRVDAALRDVDVTLVNYEGLEWLEKLPAKDLKRWDLLIADESSKLKNPQTKRFKRLKKLLNNFDRRYVMTGTPVPQTMADLFGQVYVLDGGAALGQYLTHFRLQYMVPSFDGYSWVMRPGATKEILDKIRPFSFSLSDEEYGDLPPLIRSPVEVELPPAAAAVYRRLEREMLVKLSGGEVTAVNAAVVTQKLRQVANGAIYLDDDQDVHDRQPRARGPRAVEVIHRAKLEAITELVDELEGEPLVIGYEFHHDLAALRTAFPDAPSFGAETKPSETPWIERAWNAGEVPVLLAQVGAAAHGLNLQEGPGHAVAMYSLTWNFEHYDQFVKRVWRTGQRRPVSLYPIIARGTVDEDMVAALAVKGGNQRTVFEHFKLRLRMKRS